MQQQEFIPLMTKTLQPAVGVLHGNCIHCKLLSRAPILSLSRQWRHVRFDTPHSLHPPPCAPKSRPAIRSWPHAHSGLRQTAPDRISKSEPTCPLLRATFWPSSVASVSSPAAGSPSSSSSLSRWKRGCSSSLSCRHTLAI